MPAGPSRGTGAGPAAEPLPVAMAAISVDGRCRERNPADLAIFGAQGDRLVPRFADPSLGQALLARCADSGSAEGVAALVTAGGTRRFRISLWRQRGGERIRILGAFAGLTDGPGEPPASRPESEPPEPNVLLAESLRAPVEAVLAIAGRLRQALRGPGPAEGEAGEGAPVSPRAVAALLSAGWRLRRLSDDLCALEEMRSPRLPTRLTEVDLGRLVRRVTEIVEAGRAEGTPRWRCDLPASGPFVMTDEGALWSLVEQIMARAAEGAEGAAATLTVSCSEGGGEARIEIAAAVEGDRVPAALAAPPGAARLARVRALAEAAGASVESQQEGATALRLTIRFAAGRGLDPA